MLVFFFLIMGDWENLKNLGAGGFGVVSLWRNSLTKEVLALKICRNNGEGLDPKSKENWHFEVEKMKKLDHRNIVKILTLPPALTKLSSLPILCMEFCRRGDLRKELCKPDNICGMPEESVRSILHDVKCAIEYLHNIGITHRDLKPENIVLQEVPNPTSNTVTIVYKLIDLGFAKEWDQNSLSSTVVGTLQYIAPEMLTQEYPYNRSVDYWSFGLVCHEVVTGFRPFLPSAPICDWLSVLRNKSSEHICIYDSVDGGFEYRRDIFSENHITQELKYDLEKWLRIALEWDGRKRGKGTEKSYIIFSNLTAALEKKVVTVYSVKKFERLSYPIDESTLTSTLNQWIQRDTEVPASSQLLLGPSGEILDPNTLVLPQIECDPKLVAMLYVFSKDDRLSLPLVNVMNDKHPPLVRRMMESPCDPFSYDIVKRMWANSVFFIQSILESYRAFIEAYSVKLLSLINYKKNNLLDLHVNIRSKLEGIRLMIDLSKESLDIDLENFKWNPFRALLDINKDQVWNSDYRTIYSDFSQFHKDAERCFPEVNPRLQQIEKLKHFDEPGDAYIDTLKQLLSDGRKMYSGLIKLPSEARNQVHDSTGMLKIMYPLWEVIEKIANDECFGLHLKELNEVDQDVDNLLLKLNEINNNLLNLQGKIKKMHLSRQRDVWKIAKLSVDSGGIKQENIAPALPQRNPPPKNRIKPTGNWSIDNK